MNTLLFPDEESLASGQPSRDEFNALLGRIKALERKSQQITNDDEVNNDSNKSDCRDDDDGTRIKNSSSSSPAVTAGPAVEGSGRRLGLSFVRFFRANEGRQLEELELLNDKYPLPESMFTFFITEPVLSLPCVVGYISYLVVSYFVSESPWYISHFLLERAVSHHCIMYCNHVPSFCNLFLVPCKSIPCVNERA